MDTLHNQIIEKACRGDGWQKGRWRLAFLKKCKESPYWQDEIADEGEPELFGGFRRNPDAWRLRAVWATLTPTQQAQVLRAARRRAERQP